MFDQEADRQARRGPIEKLTRGLAALVTIGGLIAAGYWVVTTIIAAETAPGLVAHKTDTMVLPILEGTPPPATVLPHAGTHKAEANHAYTALSWQGPAANPFVEVSLKHRLDFRRFAGVEPNDMGFQATTIAGHPGFMAGAQTPGATPKPKGKILAWACPETGRLFMVWVHSNRQDETERLETDARAHAQCHGLGDVRWPEAKLGTLPEGWSATQHSGAVVGAQRDEGGQFVAAMNLSYPWETEKWAQDCHSQLTNYLPQMLPEGAEVLGQMGGLRDQPADAPDGWCAMRGEVLIDGNLMRVDLSGSWCNKAAKGLAFKVTGVHGEVSIEDRIDAGALVSCQ